MCFHIVCKYYSICFFSICVLFSFQSTASTASAVWWAQVGSNHRPRAYQARALACWAMSPYRCAYPWFCARPFQTISRLGGDEEIRTLDPLLAGQVLSQLSYTPVAVLLQGFFYRPWKSNNELRYSLLRLLSLVHLSSFKFIFSFVLLWDGRSLFLLANICHMNLLSPYELSP